MITAMLSKEPEWLYAIEKGYDLHSRNAHLILPEEWVDAAEDNCAYFKDEAFSKCKCPEHKTMRVDIKTTGFGKTKSLYLYLN